MRNTQISATILKTVLSGENNWIVSYLTCENQIATAMLYGGPKSKLRSMVSPFHTGTLYIYTDPVRKISKITDFDVSAFRPALREDLYKNWAASLCSELVLKTFAGGQLESNVFYLVNGFLDGLDLVSENESRIGTLRFLWRYLGELGIQPSVTECFSCGTEFDKNEESDSVLYSPEENGFVCKFCKNYEKAAGTLEISKPALFYLQALQFLSPKEVRALTIDSKTFGQLQELIYFLVNKAASFSLNTLESRSIVW